MRYSLIILLILLAISFILVYNLYYSCKLTDEINATIEDYYLNSTSILIDNYDNRTIEKSFSDPWGYVLINPSSYYVRYDNGSWSPKSMDPQYIIEWFGSVFPESANSMVEYKVGNKTVGSAFLGSAVYGYMWNGTIEVPVRGDVCRVLRFIVATRAVWDFNYTMTNRSFIVAAAFYDEQGNLIGRNFIGFGMASREGDNKYVMYSTSYPGCEKNPSLIDINGDGVIDIRAEIVVFATSDPGVGHANVGAYALGYLEVLPCK